MLWGVFYTPTTTIVEVKSDTEIKDVEVNRYWVIYGCYINQVTWLMKEAW